MVVLQRLVQFDRVIAVCHLIDRPDGDDLVLEHVFADQLGAGDDQLVTDLPALRHLREDQHVVALAGIDLGAHVIDLVLTGDMHGAVGHHALAKLGRIVRQVDLAVVAVDHDLGRDTLLDRVAFNADCQNRIGVGQQRVHHQAGVGIDREMKLAIHADAVETRVALGVIDDRDAFGNEDAFAVRRHPARRPGIRIEPGPAVQCHDNTRVAGAREEVQQGHVVGGHAGIVMMRMLHGVFERHGLGRDRGIKRDRPAAHEVLHIRPRGAGLIHVVAGHAYRLQGANNRRGRHGKGETARRRRRGLGRAGVRKEIQQPTAPVTGNRLGRGSGFKPLLPIHDRKAR